MSSDLPSGLFELFLLGDPAVQGTPPVADVLRSELHAGGADAVVTPAFHRPYGRVQLLGNFTSCEPMVFCHGLLLHPFGGRVSEFADRLNLPRQVEPVNTVCHDLFVDEGGPLDGYGSATS